MGGGKGRREKIALRGKRGRDVVYFVAPRSHRRGEGGGGERKLIKRGKEGRGSAATLFSLFFKNLPRTAKKRKKG